MAAPQTLRRILGARSETGYVRTANEDRMGWWRTPYGDVYVISDGMGGYRGGALAAELTVKALQECLAINVSEPGNLPQLVRDAFVAANAAVYRQRRPEDPQTRDMGATGVALVAAGSHVLVGHVGDSRAYLWRRSQGLKQLTRDHTRVQKMLDAGLVTPAQAADHPESSVLDRAIGNQPSVEVDVSDWIRLKSGDMVLLCSDGLCGYVDNAEISSILRSPGDAQALADKLIDSALLNGGEDNVTVQLVYFGAASAFSVAAILGTPLLLVPATVVMSAGIAVLVSEHLRHADNAALAHLAARVDGIDRQLQAGVGAAAGVAASTPAVVLAPATVAASIPASEPAITRPAVVQPGRAKPAPAPTPAKATLAKKSPARSASLPTARTAAAASAAATPAADRVAIPQEAPPADPAVTD